MQQSRYLSDARAQRRAGRDNSRATRAIRPRNDRAATALATWTRSLIDALLPAAQAARYLEHHRLPPRELRDARMPYSACVEVWRDLTDAHPDPLFGVHFAAALEPRQLGVIGYLAAMSPTLDEALTRVVSFHRLLKDPSQNALVRGRSVLTVIDEPPAGLPPWPRHLAEATLAAYGILATRWTGRPVVPLSVRFQHAAPTAPGAAAAVAEAFGAPVTFGQDVNALELPAKVLSWPLAAADPQLSGYLEDVAKAHLEPLERAEGKLLESLRRWLLTELSSGRVGLGRAARHLARSPRTLQRELAARGRAFEDVVDEVRCAMAARLSADPAINRSEIAWMLGFADTSGLRRAERRWRRSRGP